LPEIFAPIATRKFARSTTSGSIATLRSVVDPGRHRGQHRVLGRADARLAKFDIRADERRFLALAIK
jgi:hypothetical protein